MAILEKLPAGGELSRAYSGLAAAAMMEDEAEKAIDGGFARSSSPSESGTRQSLVHALNSVGVVEIDRGDHAGREKLERSLSIAKQEDLTTDAGRAYINLSGALARRHEWALADPYIAAGTEYCRDRGLEAWERNLVACRAGSELAQGRWDAAAETADSILSGPPSSVIGPRDDALRVRALVQARRGRPDTGYCSTKRWRSRRPWASYSYSPRSPRQGRRSHGSTARPRRSRRRPTPPSRVHSTWASRPPSASFGLAPPSRDRR